MDLLLSALGRMPEYGTILKALRGGAPKPSPWGEGVIRRPTEAG